ncbi:aspartyl-tRNA synthetase [Spiroplasma sabaudiense Ar-1343]|uniref:Aspartate--tRNA ligase n=1 Tax=Spiroplasma sabaudiense Ar-1343 TaxID=1276257 RepID=W6A9M5_9MOLU|nr:aspartate--tRNA ligase [Spiroplasma sabaudiense]AHI53858.1 aspartyl-tRNA synthetase [Spiroplasma sabaudiense Ar-1343]
MKRTHTCGELTLDNKGEKVILQGWVKKNRKLGALTFIDLRDRYGTTQLLIDESSQKKFPEIKSEFVIEITGEVLERKSKNPDLKTGEIEVKVINLIIINEAKLTPFEIKDGLEANEDTKMTFRYLDLRREEMQKNLLIRSQVNKIIRDYYHRLNFIEVETPIFGKSTPEGARDFLVPSRVNVNKFYALPQSPQLYKQLLMIAGMDRYFQIAKCFRDEDLRIDRQPEFTQLDMEMSFATPEDIQNNIENLLAEIIFKVKNIKIKTPLPRITYQEAISKYGIDKPDLRFSLEINDVNDIFKSSEVNLFCNLKKNEKIRAIKVDSLLAKKDLEQLTEVAKQNSLVNLPFLKYSNNEWTGSLAKNLSDSEKQQLLKKFEIKGDCTILFAVGDFDISSRGLGAVRNEAAKILKLYKPEEINLLWVVDFPLFEFSEEENRYVAAHHPFTQPKEESLQDFDKNKSTALAAAYDIVMNGFEIGGGSQRITNENIQKRMFKAIEMSNQTVEDNFGWFINAYQYGAPYHSGCALGIDRIVMILTQASSIREVIAFPKNSNGIDPMTNAPDLVSTKQLDEINLKLK